MLKVGTVLTLFQSTNLGSSKLKRFADDNFEYDENSEAFSKRLENAVEKRETAQKNIQYSYDLCPNIAGRGFFNKTFSIPMIYAIIQSILILRC